jgi:hypothetical protein
MFYDSNGNLAKVYDITESNTNFIMRIASYNSSFIVISEVHLVNTGNFYITGFFMLLNVNTLVQTTYTFPVSVEVSPYDSNINNMAIYVINGLVFAIGSGSHIGGSSNYGMGVWQMNTTYYVSTVASIQVSSSTAVPLGGSWIIIPSTDSNSFYLIAETIDGSKLFLIDEINYSSGTITLIGIDGISGGYSGGYVYLLKNQYITSNTGNVYYEIFISYPDTVNYQICFNVIKFNNTYIDVHHKLTLGITNTSTAPYVRLLGYDFEPSISGGLDGIYNMYYVGMNYQFMQLPISLSGTLTNIISWSLVSNVKSSYFQRWQNELYAFQTGNVGGYWNINTGIMIELDYSSQTNSLCAATKFLSVAQGGSTGVGSGNNGGDGSGEGGTWGDGSGGVNGTPSPTPINNNGGTDAIVPILSSIFGNIKTDIVFVVYGIICGLLTWKLALTGLVAGIGVSTLLCVMAGLLPIWAIGLCIVLDVTLIILGSGLLNKNGNDKGAN